MAGSDATTFSILSWICQLLIDLGADVDVADAKGRTLLHAVVTKASLDMGVLRYFLSLGLDPKRVDLAGNTLWHEVAMGYCPEMSWDELYGLVALDVSPEKPNKQGKTPLHLIGSRRHQSIECINPWDLATDADKDYASPGWDCALLTTKSVNSADLDGVTPLHIASTFSEGLTEMFLRAGANPLSTTQEGLTPLHLAARSGKTNIVGHLLDSIRADERGGDALATALRQKDAMGRTALYYACWSGLPEAVRLLLEAGAVVDAATFDASPWAGCVALEDTELAEGSTFSRPAPPDAHQRTCVPPMKPIQVFDYADGAGGVSIHDNRRPKQSYSYYPRYTPARRIEEIVNMLTQYDRTVATRFIDTALRVAAEKRLDYTVECILEDRTALAGIGSPQVDAEIEASCRRRTDVQASSEPKGLPRLGHLLSVRADNAVADELREMTSGMPLSCNAYGGYLDAPFGNLILSLAHWGHWRLLSRGVPATFLRLNYRGPAMDLSTPLLIGACESAEPNMAVVRGLVEEAGVDVEERGEFRATALHCLARGGRWWQVHEALPYLLGRGAQVDGRDVYNRTPLLVALSSPAPPSFTRAAVELLLAHGADPNAVDDRGYSGQAHARDRPELVALLRANGADPNDNISRAVHGERERQQKERWEAFQKSLRENRYI